MARGYKTGGRQKGTPNKAGNELRELITNFLDENWEQVEKDMQALEPKERIKFYIDLMGYAIPKLQSTQMDVTTDEDSINQPQIILMQKNESGEFENISLEC